MDRDSYGNLKNLVTLLISKTKKEENVMDMSYDGTLVMPSSYALMDEEEMMYVEGGKIVTYSVKYISSKTCGVAAGYLTAGVVIADLVKKFHWSLTIAAVVLGLGAAIMTIAAAKGGITLQQMYNTSNNYAFLGWTYSYGRV